MVFGLGLATFLTLIVTPALLAVRIWIAKLAGWLWMQLKSIMYGQNSDVAVDRRLQRKARKQLAEDVEWKVPLVLSDLNALKSAPRAAE